MRSYKNKFVDTGILESEDVLDRGFRKYYKNKYPLSPQRPPAPFRPAWITSLETLDVVYAANNGLVRDTSMSVIYLLRGRNVTFDSMSPQVA